MKKTNNQENNDTKKEGIVEEFQQETDNMTETTEERAVRELSELQDKYLRLSAEFDNYRKRTLKEKMDLIENGGADIIKLIIPTADDFERALQAMEDGPDREGVMLIYQNFMEALRSKGLKEIEAKGEEFNVDYHEAVAKTPATAEFAPDIIVDVVQKGYMFKDSVIRFAKVVVAI